MIVRVSEDGKIVEEGDQILIGGNETYISLCRKHFFSKSLG
jgi:thymidine kinase